MVTVSIITPTYNRRHLIAETVDSVLAQTFTDFEMLIIDDGSNDGTGDFIQSRYDDPRIKYFYQENKGQNFARNNGIRRSEGEFLCFLDSDDTWPDFKLAKSLEVFKENPEIDVVYGDEMVIDEQGNELGIDPIVRFSGRITHRLLVENFIGMSASMVRAGKVKAIGGMDETIRVADDYSLWLRLSSDCVFYYLNEIMGYYRITGDQISKNIRARLDSNIYTVKKFLENNPAVISEAARNKAMCTLYSKRVRILGEYGDYKQAFRELWLAIKYKPTSLLPWRSLYRLLQSMIYGGKNKDS